jgi:UDP-glucose 4-epimerase
MAKVLVTGGAGFIGSHTLIELAQAGHDLVCVDNFCNSSPESLRRVERLIGAAVPLVQADVCDTAAMAACFAAQRIDAVVHFAALKAVGESVAHPLRYFENNIGGTMTLLRAMQTAGVKRIVFSSSATVYGNPDQLPITETAPIRTVNPYGLTKAVMEQMLADICHADPAWSAISLRYFNPIGAHASGQIGEDPRGVPNNIFPFITQVAIGKRTELAVFGNDWETPDGTGVRDYIHVVDLAKGHVAAINRVLAQPGHEQINLGTGKGTSVLDLIKAFETASGRSVPYKIAPRRAGDVAACWADPAKALALLGWKTALSLEDMCRDGWRWQSQNPNGFA